jgi:hypothetical protein
MLDDPMMLNPYQYALGSPTQYVDYTGLMPDLSGQVRITYLGPRSEIPPAPFLGQRESTAKLTPPEALGNSINLDQKWPATFDEYVMLRWKQMSNEEQEWLFARLSSEQQEHLLSLFINKAREDDWAEQNKPLMAGEEALQQKYLNQQAELMKQEILDQQFEEEMRAAAEGFRQERRLGLLESPTSNEKSWEEIYKLGSLATRRALYKTYRGIAPWESLPIIYRSYVLGERVPTVKELIPE